MTLMDMEPWETQAACRNVDPEWFFRVDYEGKFVHEEEAKDTCASCPVEALCERLIDELERDRGFSAWEGIWARKTPKERRQARRKEARRRGRPVQRAIAELEAAGELERAYPEAWLARR